MNEGVLASLITGLLSLMGVILSNAAAARKMEAGVETALAVTETRLEELTREVREHNGFARRMPVVEEQIRGLNSRVAGLEKEAK